MSTRATESRQIEHGVTNQPVAEIRHCGVRSLFALGTVVIGIKFAKLFVAFFSLSTPGGALRDIYSSWFVRISVAAVGGFLMGKILRPERKWRLAAFPMIVFFLAKVAQAIWERNSQLSYSWLVDAGKQFRLVFLVVISAVRMDLVFLGGFAILAYVSYLLTPSKYRQAWQIALAICSALLLLVSGLELAHYCKTGASWTGRMLGFFVLNMDSLWPLLRSELDLLSISALVAPILAGFAVLWMLRRWSCQLDLRFRSKMQAAFPLFLLVLLGVGFVHFRPVDHRFDRLMGNTYVVMSELLPWRNTGELEAMKRASSLPPVFDTSQTELRARSNGAPNPRNVIIVMLESARADSTSILKPELRNTPYLADFARRGAVILEMFAVIPRTAAAWVAVLEGIWPSTDEEMEPWTRSGQLRLRSLPTLLATRGYSSAFFTTTHLSFGYDRRLISNMNFQSVYDGDNLPNQGFEQPTAWGFEDRMMLEPSLNWVRRQRDDQRPFLLVLMTNVGHFDYKYPSSWQTRTFKTNDKDYGSYLNCLSYIDSVVGDFVKGLDELGVLQNSVIIILGDHGESFGEHGPHLHAMELYDEDLKVPAVLYADGLVPPGTVISGPRQQVDVFPTILDALRLTAENAILPGISLFKPVSPDRTLYFSAILNSQFTAMRSGGIKFIYNFGRIPTEVYEIDRDADERNDIAPTLPRSAIEGAEMDMLIWRERVSQAFGDRFNANRTPHEKSVSADTR